ncbi:MAG TPA: hypothetical protein DCQ36_05735 [Actinobacteria bacterium]|jgi:AcrR family transcriptional regulator|nr:hypothetical protein [Actinomycetota bacterium]
MVSSPVSPQDAANAVLQAARLAFDARGYGSVTMKSVAVAAGVAPDVVRSLYLNKERLFAAAMRLPFDPAGAVPELIAPGLDGMGRRLVRLVLTLMGDEQVRADLTRLLASDPAAGSGTDGVPGSPAGLARAAADSEAVRQVRAIGEYLSTVVIDPAVAAVGVPDARLRATVISSQLMGMATMRYLLRVEPLASASDDDVVRLLGPSIQALLDPTRREA